MALLINAEGGSVCVWLFVYVYDIKSSLLSHRNVHILSVTLMGFISNSGRVFVCFLLYINAN